MTTSPAPAHRPDRTAESLLTDARIAEDARARSLLKPAARKPRVGGRPGRRTRSVLAAASVTSETTVAGPTPTEA
ncbi:hypothetical protein [Brevibacterium litoralis]|uniref:hypothetical protein n=1 Tax=Brevibacterium litoralis TaxID=3138935 RepID=UPI0032EDA527